jgi:hypothetical protein
MPGLSGFVRLLGAGRRCVDVMLVVGGDCGMRDILLDNFEANHIWIGCF